MSLQPELFRLATTFEPINPAPPVTKNIHALPCLHPLPQSAAGCNVGESPVRVPEVVETSSVKGGQSGRLTSSPTVTMHRSSITCLGCGRELSGIFRVKGCR